jgi:hypothetical protein
MRGEGNAVGDREPLDGPLEFYRALYEWLKEYFRKEREQED